MRNCNCLLVSVVRSGTLGYIFKPLLRAFCVFNFCYRMLHTFVVVVVFSHFLLFRILLLCSRCRLNAIKSIMKQYRTIFREQKKNTKKSHTQQDEMDMDSTIDRHAQTHKFPSSSRCNKSSLSRELIFQDDRVVKQTITQQMRQR